MKFFSFIMLGAASAVSLNAETEGVCVVMPKTAGELTAQLDKFSKTLNRENWNNAVTIKGALGSSAKLEVHTWELYNKAWSWPRVRRYPYVQENLDLLEHF